MINSDKTIHTKIIHSPLGGMAYVGDFMTVVMQNGPIKEKGVNGVQIDNVLRFARDRLMEFNQPPYENEHNARAVLAIDKALCSLSERTAEREKRGVEGTSDA